VSSPERIQIAVLCEPVLVREALAHVLARDRRLRVVGQASVREGARRPWPADVVAVDLVGLQVDPRATVADVVAASGPARVLALVDDRRQLAEAVIGGARGALGPNATPEALADAAVALGRTAAAFDPADLAALLDELVAWRLAEEDAADRLARLTAREREVVEMLLAGARNDEIAAALVISPQTAKRHVQNVLRRLGVHSRLEAVALARRAGGRAWDRRKS
jgi:DNA-binding NarL/FixJ family response regulator